MGNEAPVQPDFNSPESSASANTDGTDAGSVNFFLLCQGSHWDAGYQKPNQYRGISMCAGRGSLFAAGQWFRGSA